MNAFTRTMILAAALVLAGCATYRVADMPAGSTTEQVAARAGKPTDTWRDGSTEVWEYATGPSGRMTYLARFDDGRLTSTRQVLTEETFQKVVPGTTRSPRSSWRGPETRGPRGPARYLDPTGWA